MRYTTRKFAGAALVLSYVACVDAVIPPWLSFTLAAFALALFAPENCGTVVTGIGVGVWVVVVFSIAVTALGVIKPPRLLRLDLDRLDLDRLERLDRLVRFERLDRLDRLVRLLPPL